MKPDFPSLIITPRTPNRISRTTGAEELIDRLREHDINASAFLMDADLLAEAEKKGFQNNRDRAVDDLLDQLPDGVAKAVLGDKKDDGGNGGGSSNGGSGGGPDGGDDDDGEGGMGLGMNMPGPSTISPARKRQREEEERRREELERGPDLI